MIKQAYDTIPPPAGLDPYLKLLFDVNAPDLFVVHDKTLPRNHHVDTTTTKPSPFSRNPFDSISQFSIITTTRQIPHR